MQNPSYLIKSRHDVYYFRYPLPIKAFKKERRISISLQTRCPREALRLAKALEYHSVIIIAGMNLERMDYVDILSILKSHYAEVLEELKTRINTKGRLPQKSVELFTEELRIIDELIKDESDDFLEMLGAEYENPEQSLDYKLKEIMRKHGLDFEKDSEEYKNLRAAYKFVRRNCLRDVLAYNNQITDFSLLSAPQNAVNAHINHHNPEYKLSSVIESYLSEIKAGLKERSFNEQRDCLGYLIDWLGAEYPITKIDDGKAREAKEYLRGTPKGRNKNKFTVGLGLVEQIAIAKEHDLPLLSNKSVNKYLTYFEGLFKWAERNRYRDGNPFFGIRVKDSKKKSRRDKFDKHEINKIIENLDDGTPTKLVKHSSYYWGALIAIYTGARRNEIASLLPDDVKYDELSGIWYFDITDEEEAGKGLKTDAAKRVVPIHSRLLELGFLDFVEEARGMKGKIKNKHGYEARLLYKLTYTDHDKWGRNLGRWFNDNYLAELGLKTDKKTLHSLRHSFITYLSASGADNAIVKSIVGHEADTVTTQVYTHYGVEHLPVFKEAIGKLPY